VTCLQHHCLFYKPLTSGRSGGRGKGRKMRKERGREKKKRREKRTTTTGAINDILPY